MGRLELVVDGEEDYESESNHSTEYQDRDEWSYVDCGGVVRFAPEPVERVSNQLSLTAAIMKLQPQRISSQRRNTNSPQKLQHFN